MKFILGAVLLLLLVVTPVLAQPGKNEDKSTGNQGQAREEKKPENNQGNNQEKSQGQENKDNPGQGSDKKEAEKVNAANSPAAKRSNTSRISVASGSGQQNCDPNYPWKNHGEYVSCVAKSGAGGQAVSEAARSDIGKKGATPSASLSPEASGSASPSATASPTPEATSSGLINSITENLATVQESIISIGDQFAALLELLNPFN